MQNPEGGSDSLSVAECIGRYFAVVLLFLYDGDFVTLTNQHRKVGVIRRFALDFAPVDFGFILISRLFHKPILFQFPKRL